MKYFFVVLLYLVGFMGYSFAQTTGDAQDDMWLPACHVGTGTQCDKSFLFHDAISKPFAQSDSVAVGTIIQTEDHDKNSIRYSIDVDFYLKNPQPFDLLTATLNNATKPPTFPDVLYYNSPVFNEGDLVFVYLQKSGGVYDVLPESFALDKQEARGPPPTIMLTKSPSEETFKQGEKITASGEVRKMELVKAARDGERLDVKITLHEPYDKSSIVFSDLADIDTDGSYEYDLKTSTIPPGKYELEVNYGPSTTGTEITVEFNSKYWSPLKQFKSGVTMDQIQCRKALVLMSKHDDGSPACVKPESIPKLVQRGWMSEIDEHSSLAYNKVLESCTNDSPQERMENPLRHVNGTHAFLNLGCEWKKIGKYLGEKTESSKVSNGLETQSEKTSEVTGSYELDGVPCLGGRGMILNEKCERIGKYDLQTGIPIVENKVECDLLNGTWHDEQNKCDSKYAPLEYRFQFGYLFLGYEKPQVCTDDMMRHLAIYSNMFVDEDEEEEEGYSIEWIGLGENIDPDDFDACENELLKLR